MYDWKEKNQISLLLVQLFSKLQVRWSVYWLNFLCSSLDIFPFWWDCISWKQRQKAKRGEELGRFPSSSERQCRRDRNVINNSIFLSSSNISEWHQKRKQKKSLQFTILSFNNTSCSSVKALLFASCGSYKNKEHVSQPCLPTVPPPECLPPAQVCRPGLAHLAAQSEPH